MQNQPTVSIIVPCFNEEKRIRFLLDAIFAQTYPRALMEVCIADGHSQDGTRAVIDAFRAEHPDLPVRVVDNDARTIPAALNRTLEMAQHDIIVRLDAHSAPHVDYVTRCVDALTSGVGDNVGGVWEIRPGAASPIAQAIAAAAAHPLGVGDALYRHARQAAYVDTVPFGAYRRETVARVGAFDESLLSNEDYEWNARLRQAGGKIWLDPQIRSIYFARSTLGELAHQYWRYGYWKWQMLKRYPSTLRWRQALPPLFVFVLIVLLALAPVHWIFALLLALQVVVYAAPLALVGLWQVAKTRNLSLLWMPLAMATMHFAWGGGFLWSFLTTGVRHER
jgi:succinoglycan biosynthesis protein ExoA